MKGAAAAVLPSDLSLRALGPGDAAAAAALIAACDRTYLEWAPHGWRPPSEREEREKWKGRLSDPGRWALGAFDQHGALVGMVAVRQATDGNDEPIVGRCHVGALFVHPVRWREGIATNLLEQAEAAMREHGFHHAVLRTPEWAPARRFYQANGWTSTGGREYREDFRAWIVRYEKELGSVP